MTHPEIVFPRAAGSGSHNALYGVTCLTWTNCVAVGAKAARGSLAFRPIASRWTGTRWRAMAVPAPARQPRALLTKVSCQSRANCVASGYHYSRSGRFSLLAERWNGRRWSIIQSANPPGVPSAFLNSVTCVLRVGCMAVGGHASGPGTAWALAERWSGGRWRRLRLRRPPGAVATELDGVSCARGKCLAVGQQESASGQGLPLAERWNGRRWMLMRIANTKAPLTVLDDISCATPGLCMAVGATQWTRQRPLTELWRDGRWQLARGSRAAGGTLSGVSCQNPAWCMAVGSVGNRTLTQAWYGQKWRVVRAPKAGGHPADQLSQLSCRTGNGRCVTVGARYQPGRIFDESMLAEYWNGTSWRVMATRTP